jgi:uncharacterized sulfatase
VPLAICWGNKIEGSQTCEALVSSVSFAPTILDAAGITVDSSRYAPSLLPLLVGKAKEYRVKQVFAGRERHSYSRYLNMGYPVRSIRQGNYLMVHNFKPHLWPAGDPGTVNSKGDYEPGFAFYDIDDSPSKLFLILNRENPAYTPFYELAVAKRPEFELFDVVKDPGCTKNLAYLDKYAETITTMKKCLQDMLILTKDTRLGSNPEIWESYPRLEGKMRNFPELK